MLNICTMLFVLFLVPSLKCDFKTESKPAQYLADDEDGGKDRRNTGIMRGTIILMRTIPIMKEKIVDAAAMMRIIMMIAVNGMITTIIIMKMSGRSAGLRDL